MNDTRREPQHIHPDEYEQDLNPDFSAGQNSGAAGPQPGKSNRTAYDVKDAHRNLRGFADDELKQIPVVASGSRLEQGATYLDLANLSRGEIQARGDMTAGDDNAYVAKTEVDYQLWNRLRGVQEPERLGQADAE